MTSNTKTALITGASSGIGAAYAHELAARGYNLILVARREELLNKLADELQQKHGITAGVLVADLSDMSGIQSVEQRIAETGDLEMLINNAGFGVRGKFAGSDLSKYQAMLDVHATATMRLTHAALPGMIERGRGTIINLSSMAAFMNRGGGPVYAATKAFINVFSDNLQSELDGTGIKIQSLCPGFTYTGFHDTSEYEDYSRSSLPSFLWMPAEAVVVESLKALKRKKVIFVPGFRYRVLTFLMKSGLGRFVGKVRRWLEERRR